MFSWRGSERDPEAAFVVTATFVIVAIVIIFVAVPLLMEIPVIGMNVELDTWRARPSLSVPAVAAIAVAYNIGGSGGNSHH